MRTGLLVVVCILMGALGARAALALFTSSATASGTIDIGEAAPISPTPTPTPTATPNTLTPSPSATPTNTPTLSATPTVTPTLGAGLCDWAQPRVFEGKLPAGGVLDEYEDHDTHVWGPAPGQERIPVQEVMRTICLPGPGILGIEVKKQPYLILGGDALVAAVRRPRSTVWARVVAAVRASPHETEREDYVVDNLGAFELELVIDAIVIDTPPREGLPYRVSLTFQALPDSRAATRGYVLLMAGIDVVHRGDDPVDACDRASKFGLILREIRTRELAGFTPRCFSYDGAGPEYVYGDTRQLVSTSAVHLQRQIAELVLDWRQAHGTGGSPEFVILTHSLGGAVLAAWASDAHSQQLDMVTAAITLDGPVRGTYSWIQRLLAHFFSVQLPIPAIDELEDDEFRGRMAWGTARLRIGFVGNDKDKVVVDNWSYTPFGLASLRTVCSDKPVNHGCVFEDPNVLSFVRAHIPGLGGSRPYRAELFPWARGVDDPEQPAGACLPAKPLFSPISVSESTQGGGFNWPDYAGFDDDARKTLLLPGVDGPERVYRVLLDRGSTIRVRVAANSVPNLRLALLARCDRSDLVALDRGGALEYSRPFHPPHPSGPKLYFLVVDSPDISPGGDFGLTGDILPAVPTNLRARSAGPDRITLTWQDNATDETGYRVEFKVGKNSVAWVILPVLAANSSGFSHSGLNPHTEYCYRVRAVREDLSSEFSNEWCATTAQAR